MATVVVLGSFNMDLTVVADRLPRPGQTVLGHTFYQGPGGKGSNQAIACRRLGAEVSFLGAVGEDSFGQTACNLFHDEGINTDGLAVLPLPTGVALIVVDAHAENQIAVARGANAEVTPQHVQQYEDIIAQADVLIAQMETPVETFISAAQTARRNGAKVILNPAPALPLPPPVWDLIDVFTPNQHELLELTQVADPFAVPHQLIDKGVEVVVTLGAEGVVWHGKHGTTSFPARKAEPIDTTGAGDAFNAGLAVGLAESDLAAGIQLGLRAGAYAVTRLGVQEGLASRRQLNQEFPPESSPTHPRKGN